MLINFPANPTLNQQFTYLGIGHRWTWTGSAWQVTSVAEVTGGKVDGFGIVILRVPIQYSDTFSAGISSNVAASTSQARYRTYTVTAGTGTVTFN